MASSRVSPPRRPFQAPPTLAPKASDRLAVPKYHVADPLLGNLSPESTLQALSSTDAVPKNEQAAHDILSKSIYQASPTERALGIRAAVAAQKLGQWYREVHAWGWPKRSDAQLGKGFIPPSDEESGYCGCLPTAVVEEHEKRIEEIRDGMDNLDVEELKEHVLNAHIPGRSRPSSANSTMSVPPPLSYVQLSDFTAVITATILRALPLLSRLNSLLSTWNVRLLVLRQIPGLLQSLRFARSELNFASDLLKSSIPPTEGDVLYSMVNYHAKRVTLESAVLSAGRKMDRILDSLDGREDSLPESWIDNLEAIEAEFASWVMEAEKLTVGNEWRRLSVRENENDKPEVDLTQPELPDGRDYEESPADAVKIEAAKSPSIESPNPIDAVVALEPEHISQTRLAPLQIGRTPPMETIVEEIGSPFDRPSSQSARGINDVFAANARIAPESPSPLPHDPIGKQDTLESVPVMLLDASCSTAASAGVQHARPCPADVSEEPMKLSEESNDQLSTNSSVVMPAIFNEQQRDLIFEEDTPRSPIDVSPTEEHVHIHKESNDEASPTNIILEPATRSDTPPSDAEIEGNTSPSVDVLPVEKSLSLSRGSDNDCLAVSHVETSVSSDSEEILPYTATQFEENTWKKAQSSAPPDTTSTDLPSTDSVRAEPQESEQSTQLALEEPHPQTQALPSKADTKAQLSVSQASADSEPLFERNDRLPAGNEPSKAGEELERIAMADSGTKCFSLPENKVALAEGANSEELQPIAELNDYPQLAPAGGESIDRDNAVIESTSPPSENYTPKSSKRCVTPPNNNVASLPNLFVPHDNSKVPTEQHDPEEPEKDEKNTSKKPLDSPIKLSKIRPGQLDLDKHKTKSRVRWASNASDGSLSDYPSLVSSPGIPEQRTSSSNGTPLLLETPPHFGADYRPSKPTPRGNDHTLREDRLLHLDAQKPSPRDAFAHNRTLSLPLQRFINESVELNYDPGSGNEEDAFSGKPSGHKKKVPAPRPQRPKSASSTSDIERSNGQELAPTRGDSSGPDSDGSSHAQPKAQKEKAKMVSRNSPDLSTRVEPPSGITTTRLKKRLTAHPSLESIGPYKSDDRPSNSSKPILGKTKSRSSSLNKPLIRPKDQMDEKINSILTSLPGHIHLVPADQDDDAISVTSSVPFRRERFRSDSPQGTPSRSFTPTPSLSLRPGISRRRHSHAPEESSVKLYHLHRGGKSAPTKLFVRTVGENGGRVMVRVGGGWADLAEYLREYAIHHGRRHVSETPRVEVEGLSSRSSPVYSPPASRVPSGNGRHMPARPPSVLSNRPSSSIAVRKTRRSSNVSDIGDIRSASAGDALNVSFSPMSTAHPARRLSVSSNVSAGAMSSVSEARHGSPGAPAIPLGLAGPKPRAKHATISPESEAWVEDVLGQARRSSSLRPLKYTLPSLENEAAVENTPTLPKPALPKSRSISDIGKAGSSKRVALRGLR